MKERKKSIEEVVWDDHQRFLELREKFRETQREAQIALEECVAELTSPGRYIFNTCGATYSLIEYLSIHSIGNLERIQQVLRQYSDEMLLVEGEQNIKPMEFRRTRRLVQPVKKSNNDSK